MLENVTKEQWREFDEDGFVSLGIALSASELRSLSDRLDAIMLGEVDLAYDRLLMQVE
eukprot:SAG11_NODE_35182_length_268_cov_0.550296_1_plen_57_part_01